MYWSYKKTGGRRHQSINSILKVKLWNPNKVMLEDTKSSSTQIKVKLIHNFFIGLFGDLLPWQIVGALKCGTKMENNPENSTVNSFKFFHVVFDYSELHACQSNEDIDYSVNDTGMPAKRKPECSYKESNLRPSDY